MSTDALTSYPSKENPSPPKFYIHSPRSFLQSYSNFNEAAAAVADQLDAIRKIFWDRDAALLPTDFAEDPKVSPIAIMVAHAMVLCVPEGRDKLSPTEIKVMKVMTLPSQFDPKTHPRTSDVWKMAECLNCKVAYVV